MREIILYEDEEDKNTVELNDKLDQATFVNRWKASDGEWGEVDRHTVKYSDIKRTHEAIEKLNKEG